MMTFDTIARELLQEQGYEVIECETDKEAVEKAEQLKKGSKQYPVHFSESDTSGEKPFEEFYTDTESIDMNRFKALGVIVDKKTTDKYKIEKLFSELMMEFEKEEATKNKVVQIIKEYLPNFEHNEKGKTLDCKM